RQGAMTSSGGHHARKSNAADGEKDKQIMPGNYGTRHSVPGMVPLAARGQRRAWPFVRVIDVSKPESQSGSMPP
ncbi:MAG: hypothetical protein OXU75_03140, partial [Deltaproteobacteria bacterium]|nr:hypothetical protein [Deltaproteobacteria bacterium]